MDVYGLLNTVDFPMARLFNQAARQVAWLDQSLAFISANHLLKGGVLMALLWWVWFRRDAQGQGRVHMAATLLACLLALVIGRLMVLGLPYRARPLYEPALDLLTPYGVAPGALDRLSSFPSDHAVLFFALATGFFFISRRAALLALGYVMLFIALPRLYLGIHYPTDILAGGLIGAAVCIWANRVWVRQPWLLAGLQRLQGHPALLYPLLFLLTYQIADLFENSRSMVGGLVTLALTLSK